MKKYSFIFLLFWMMGPNLFAQHEHHQQSGNAHYQDTIPDHKMDSMPINSEHDHRMTGEAMEMGAPMSHAFSLNLPMSRNGSGTGWLPDASPMYGHMIHSRKWMYMIHGNAFLRYNNQDFSKKGIRGGDKIDIPNWVMFMGQRKAGRGLLHFSSMFSIDKITTGGYGYPLLFQTGESYKGKALVDRQHPHDLFSELSVSYSYAISKKADVFIYAGYPGEPALGPVAFMHRPSALDNPNAPVSHHWIDATHITFGVATLGARLGKFKIEGSSFTGREPDENRYNFDKPRFDSWSGRLSMNPSANWSLQVSHGFVKSPEELHASENVNKTTASAIYNSNIKGGNYFSGTAVWGLNKTNAHSGENAVLLEAALHQDKTAFYGRYEFTQKSSEELILDESQYGAHTVFGVNAFTIGFNHDISDFNTTKLAIGANYSIYMADRKLDDIYGRYPMSFQVYLRWFPVLMKM